MSKLPPKKQFIITSNQKPTSTPPEESLRSLGSFKLRFKSGSTVKRAAPEIQNSSTVFITQNERLADTVVHEKPLATEETSTGS